MPEKLPCPICKNPITTSDADARGKICCTLCLHEFLLRGQRLTPWVDLDGLDVSPPLDEVELAGPENIVARVPSPTPMADYDDRPRRRRRPAPPPAKSRTLLIVGLVGLAVVVISGVIAIPTIFVHQRRNVARNFAVKQANLAFRNLAIQADPARDVPPAMKDEVRRYFDDLSKIIRAGDRDGFIAQFDFDRILDDLADANLIPDDFLRDRHNFALGLRRGFTNELNAQAPLFEFHRFEIVSLRDLGNSDVAVVIRGSKDGDGSIARFRYWISKRQGFWRIHDLEDLDLNLRISHVIGSVTRFVEPREAKQFSVRFNHLKEAILAVAAQNVDLAEQKLLDAGPQPFPATIEALRHVVQGCIHVQRNQPRESLDAFARARQHHPDMAKLDFMEAVAHNQLGESGKALERLERYRNLMGDDAEVCRELGHTFRGLNRFKEAVAELRKALDYFPKDQTTLLLLVQSLSPADKRDDIGPRFAKLDNPAQHFEMFAKDCLDAQDWLSLEPLALEMAKIDPQSTAAEFYLATVRVNQNKADLALPLIKKALAREKNEQLKADYWQRFMQSLVRIGKGPEAYKLAPDRKEAFRLIGGELQKSYRLVDLRWLVNLHKKNFPDDPLIPLFQAHLCVQDGDHEKAETLFAEAIAQKADFLLVGQAQSQRILNRYRLGKAMSAYEEFGPKDQTFTQLSELAWMDRNVDVLEKLVTAQEAFNAQHEMLGRARYRAKLLAKKGNEAAILYKRALANIADVQALRNLTDSFTVDCVDTDQGLLAYQTIHDFRPVFERLASNYLGQGRRDELTALLALHRQRVPDDPWIDFYQGELHVDDREWAKAATAMASAWRNARGDERLRMQFAYHRAMVKADQWLTAYRESIDKDKAFFDLGRQLIAEKQWANLNRLIAQHRPSKNDDPETLMLQCRAKIAAKNINDAWLLYQRALAHQPADGLRRTYLNEFVGDLADQDRGLEGYRLVADKSAAFDLLAFRLQAWKKLDLLEALIREHAQSNPADPHLHRYRGDLAFERGDLAAAEREYRAGLAVPSVDQWSCRIGVERVRVKSGGAVQLYLESSDDPMAFGNIARSCLLEKDAAQLKALIDEHKKNQPDDPALMYWALELLVLNKDDAGIVAMHADIVKGPRRIQDEPFLKDRLIRALIHLKKIDEAERVAEEYGKNRYADRMLPLLTAAAKGSVNKAIAAAANAHPTTQNLYRFYQDPDLGPLLRQESFRRFRDRYPEPPPGQDFNGRFDDFD